MSFAPSIWKQGRPACYFYRDKIEEEDRCESCLGHGESSSMHKFIGGWSHIPCLSCHGSGIKEGVDKEKYKKMSPLYESHMILEAMFNAREKTANN